MTRIQTTVLSNNMLRDVCVCLFTVQMMETTGLLHDANNHRPLPTHQAQRVLFALDEQVMLQNIEYRI